jgi:Glycosyltransferase family 87
MLARLITLLRRPATAGLLAFALVLPAFAVLKAHSAPHYALSKAEAVRVARADPPVARALARQSYTRVRVSPIDKREQRVSFFRGGRLVLHAAVGPGPRVTHLAKYTPGTPQSGSLIVNYPPVLALLALLFVAATATVPLLSLRNLDVLAFASFTVPIWLMNKGLVEASVLWAYPLLAYLMARCLAIGLGGRQREPRRSVYWHLTRRWSETERRRIPSAVLAGLAVLTTLVTVTSTGPSDVAFAALSGATDLVHGVVPYGHIPSFILHGDTYPLLTYVLYVPAAAVTPVNDLFDDPQGALIITAVAMLATAWGLYRIVARVARGGPASAEDEPASVTGVRAALAWLAFSPVLLTASSGSNDVLLAAFLVAALASVGNRRRSTVLLGLAAWVKVIPVLALPIWFARMRRRGALEALASLALVSAALLGWLVALGGGSALVTMAHALSFQFERGSLSSLWTGMGVEELQPVAQAALVSVIAAATLAVRRDRTLRDDLPRLAALLAGVILLAQFAANFWTWAYLPWALAPALLVLIPSPSRVAVRR